MKTHGRCLWERAISCWLREFGRVPVNFRTCNSDALCILSTEFSMYVSRYLSRSPQISPTFRQKFLSSSYEERPFHTSYLVGMEIRIFCLARLLFAPLCIIRRRTCDFVPFFCFLLLRDVSSQKEERRHPIRINRQKQDQMVVDRDATKTRWDG